MERALCVYAAHFPRVPTSEPRARAKLTRCRSDTARVQDLGETTTFGTAWDVRESLAQLRARASRFGAALEPAQGIDAHDAAAAIIGVDAWMVALQATDLERPSRYGTAAVAALARLLARAAGQALSDDEEDELPSADVRHLARAARYAAWVQRLELDAATVLQRAATDLQTGSGNERLSSMAAALAATASGG